MSVTNTVLTQPLDLHHSTHLENPLVYYGTDSQPNSFQGPPFDTIPISGGTTRLKAVE